MRSAWRGFQHLFSIPDFGAIDPGADDLGGKTVPRERRPTAFAENAVFCHCPTGVGVDQDEICEVSGAQVAAVFDIEQLRHTV